MSTRKLALQIVKTRGCSYETAMQLADAQRQGQTPRLTVRALAKTFEQQGYKPADALRAAENQLGRKLAEDEDDEGGDDDVQQRQQRVRAGGAK
jgi:hypothetical protein